MTDMDDMRLDPETTDQCYLESEEGANEEAHHFLATHRTVDIPLYALLELVSAAIEEGAGDRVGAAIAHIEMLTRYQGWDLKATFKYRQDCHKLEQ